MKPLSHRKAYTAFFISQKHREEELITGASKINSSEHLKHKSGGNFVKNNTSNHLKLEPKNCNQETFLR